MLSDFHSGGSVLVLCEELGQCDHKGSCLYCHGDFPLRILPAMHFRALVKPPDKAKLNAGGVTTVLTTQSFPSVFSKSKRNIHSLKATLCTSNEHEILKAFYSPINCLHIVISTKCIPLDLEGPSQLLKLKLSKAIRNRSKIIFKLHME